jgi:hypothetical protein
MDPQAVVPRIQRWCGQHPGTVLFDEASAVLCDVFSGKSLALDLKAVSWVEERLNQVLGGSYLVLGFEEGPPLVLSDPGLAFTPETRNTGPLASLPPAVCFRDFENVSGKLRHILVDHPEHRGTREEVDMVQFCVALLDGARRVGLDVGREERSLEALLALLERRGLPEDAEAPG